MEPLLLEHLPDPEAPKPGSKARGRPLYEPTEKDRTAVKIMRAAGLIEEAIALALGISKSCLRRAFKVELRTASAMLAAECMVNLIKIAKREGGGFSAVRANELILERIDRQGITVFEEDRTLVPGGKVLSDEGEVRMIAEIPANGRE